MTGLNANDNNDMHEELRHRIEQAPDRAGLVTMRDHFSDRLRRRSDDVDATLGLRLVTAKLQRAPYGEPLVTKSTQARKTDRHRPLPRRGSVPVGTPVEVRTRYRGSWSNGFAVARATDEGYWLRRESDQYLLPTPFVADQVRRPS